MRINNNVGDVENSSQRLQYFYDDRECYLSVNSVSLSSHVSRFCHIVCSMITNTAKKLRFIRSGSAVKYKAN